MTNGLNDRCRQALDVLARAGQLAVAEGCDFFYILGDLFESSNPNTRTVAATMDVLGSINDKMSGGVVVMSGNHDIVSEAPGDHALGPIGWAVDAVVDAPKLMSVSTSMDVLTVPYRSGVLGDWLPLVLTDICCAIPQGDSLATLPLRVLALHQGIIHAGTKSFLLKDPSAMEVHTLAKLVADHDVDVVVSGHWHQHWGANIAVSRRSVSLVQVGALCPRGWSDAGLRDYGRVVIVAPDAPSVVHEIGGPRFVCVSEWDGLSSIIHEHNASRLDCSCIYVDWRVPHDCLSSARAELDAAIERGDVCRGVVVPDDASVRDGVRRNAASVRQSNTLMSAIEEHVSRMIIPSGVVRGDVLDRVKSYLSGDVK